MAKADCKHETRVTMPVVVGLDPRTGMEKVKEVCVPCAGKLFGKAQVK